MQTIDEKILYSASGLSRLISIPAYTLKKIAREGLIPGIRLPGKWLFDKDKVIAALNKCCSNDKILKQRDVIISKSKIEEDL